MADNTSINSSIRDDQNNEFEARAIQQSDSSSIKDFDLGKISTCGDNDEFVIIGNHKYYRDELMTAFGGTLNPGFAPPPAHILGSATPMGLMAFGVTLIVFGLCKSQAMGVEVSNIVVGSAFFYGGLVEFLAGCWELASANTFAGTAFVSLGSFWFSYAAIYVDNFDIQSSYSTTTEFNYALGFFFLGWAIFFSMMATCTLKSTWPFFGFFFFIVLTFLLSAISGFTLSVKVDRAAGVISIITSMFSFYNAMAGLCGRQNAYFTFRPLTLPFAPKSPFQRSK